jgi:putative salt-induced outer membrane protein YdiY
MNLFLRICLKWLVGCFLICCTAGLWYAQENQTDAAKKTQYASSTSFSLVLARGNNKNYSFSVDSEHRLQINRNRFNFRGRFLNSKSDREKTSEIYYSHLKYDRQLGDSPYLLSFVRYERNKLAGYNYRIALSVGGGSTWIKQKTVELSSELAVGWNNENNTRKINLADLTNSSSFWENTLSTSFVSGIMDHKIALRLSENSRLEHQETLFINLEDVSDYRINSYSAISVALNSWLALKTSFQLVYEHQPVEGFKSIDFFLLSSLVIKI